MKENNPPGLGGDVEPPNLDARVLEIAIEHEAQMDRLGSRGEADIELYRALATAEAALTAARAPQAEQECEFCGRTEPEPMHVCPQCWNGANNATWQHRAVEAEAELISLREQQAECLDDSRVQMKPRQVLAYPPVVSGFKKATPAMVQDDFVVRDSGDAAHIENLEGLILWALGESPIEGDEFPMLPDDWPRRKFYWRKELRRRFEALRAPSAPPPQANE